MNRHDGFRQLPQHQAIEAMLFTCGSLNTSGQLPEAPSQERRENAVSRKVLFYYKRYVSALRDMEETGELLP